MDFHCGQAYGLERVQDRDARVRIGRRIDHDGVLFTVGALDLFHKRPLVIGLEDLDLNAELGGALVYIIFKIMIAAPSVDLGFADAEHV